MKLVRLLPGGTTDEAGSCWNGYHSGLKTSTEEWYYYIIGCAVYCTVEDNIVAAYRN